MGLAVFLAHLPVAVHQFPIGQTDRLPIASPTRNAERNEKSSSFSHGYLPFSSLFNFSLSVLPLGRQPLIAAAPLV
jgi:hypothetical protein